MSGPPHFPTLPPTCTWSFIALSVVPRVVRPSWFDGRGGYEYRKIEEGVEEFGS